jgi:putative exporter of polyketide antibiotics
LISLPEFCAGAKAAAEASREARIVVFIIVSIIIIIYSIYSMATVLMMVDEETNTRRKLVQLASCSRRRVTER